MKRIAILALLFAPIILFAQHVPGKSQKLSMPVVLPPLYVVDGKILPEKVKVGEDSTQLVNSIESIDPKDIERIDVLNGPSAIEKYGDAGKNGVVLIVTKSQSQKPKKN